MCNLIHGWELSENKLNRYLKIAGIINDVFRPEKALQKTRIKVYNTKQAFTALIP